MLAVPKQEIIILDSNVDETDPNFDVWDGTAKDADAFVQVVSNHTIYRSTVDGNTLNPLEDTYNKSWAKYGNTNYLKAFDHKRSSKCENDYTIYYKFQTSDIDSLAFIGLEAKSVTIKLTNNTTSDVVFEESYDTIERDVYDWYDWTYAPAEYKGGLFVNLPLVYDGILEVTIDNTGDTAKVSHIAYGRALNLGLTLAKPEPIASIRNIASKSRDVFGDFQTELNVTYKRMIVNVILDSLAVDRVQQRLEKLNGIPCLFVGDDRNNGYSSLVVYGMHKDFDMPISTTMSQYQLEVEGFN